MIKTTFLSNEDYNFKEFHSFNVFTTTGFSFNPYKKQKIVNDIINKTCQIIPFYIKSGEVFLKHVNFIYCLEDVKYNTDIVLPSNPKPTDWLVLYYEQTTAFNLTNEKFTKILLKRNKERIMGYDEDLVCDIPFLSLRLTYLDKQNGWLVT